MNWFVGLCVLFLIGGLAGNLGLISDAYEREATLSETAVGLASAMATGMYSWDQTGTQAVLNYEAGVGGLTFIVIGVVIIVYILAMRLFYRMSKFIINLFRPPKGWAREKLIALAMMCILIALFSGGLGFWRALLGAVL